MTEKVKEYRILFNDEDTLNLVIPPSKSIKENKEALELYKKKYHSEEAA